MKELKLEDYAIIKPYLDMANYEGYNSNFVTMMMWNHEYHIQYEIRDHYLVMLHDYKGVKFWAMPFTSPEYYQDAINYMMNYSEQHGFDFIIQCAIESFVNDIRSHYQNQLLFERTPWEDDYVYDRQMLQTLAGKKMQKRRNHYNAFVKEHPNYEYRDLDITKDFETILTCLNRWEYEKENLSESMTSEVRGVMYLLSSKHLLNFEVGGIFIDGQMEAFIIASQLKHSTVQIHVEKANKEIRGLYPAILKELLEHHYPDDKYVNREEDMGLANLRKSKQSLHPVKMIHKYSITKKDFHVMKAVKEDQERITQLWQVCFPDETISSTQYYFDYLYNCDNTFVLKNNQHIISVLQIVPMTIHINNQDQLCYFILGVCTDPNFQGQGAMKYLLESVLSQYQGQSLYLQAYVPAIYEPFGFHASHYHKKIILDTTKLSDNTIEPNHDLSCLDDYYRAYTRNFDEYRIRDDNYWLDLRLRCNAFEDRILVFEDAGYCIYHEDENQVYISEFIYLNADSACKMLGYFKHDQRKIILECDLHLQIEGEQEKVLTMMSNCKQSHQDFDNKYINEIY